MVQCCIVPQCRNKATTKGVSFHSVPKNEVIRRLWLQNISCNERHGRNVSDNVRVCSAHFVESDYAHRASGKKCLKPRAVPSIFTFTLPRESVMPGRELLYVQQSNSNTHNSVTEVKDEIEVHEGNEWTPVTSAAVANVTDACATQVAEQALLDQFVPIIKLEDVKTEVGDELEIRGDGSECESKPIEFIAVDTVKYGGAAQEKYWSQEWNYDRKIDCKYLNNSPEIHSSGVTVRCGEEEEADTSVEPAHDGHVSNHFYRSYNELHSLGVESSKSEYVGRCNRPTLTTCSVTPAVGQDISAAREHLEDSFTCDICGKSFRRKQSLVSHVKAHTDERPYGCAVCGKTYRDKQVLTIHVRDHAGERRYKCEVCNKGFKRKSQLSAHAAVHTSDRAFSCKVCGKAFRAKTVLRVHSIVHATDKAFHCNLCGKTFRRKQELSNHSLVHSSERPFTCNLCGKAFKSKQCLFFHGVVHASERPFSCEVCGKAFKQKCVLNVHAAVHSSERPFTCERCGKAFKGKGDLIVHAAVHTSERPFACERCGKAFKLKRDLNAHAAVHTSERAFSCNQCGKTFKGKKALSIHVVKHTSENS